MNGFEQLLVMGDRTRRLTQVLFSPPLPQPYAGSLAADPVLRLSALLEAVAGRLHPAEALEAAAPDRVFPLAPMLTPTTPPAGRSPRAVQSPAAHPLPAGDPLPVGSPPAPAAHDRIIPGRVRALADGTPPAPRSGTLDQPAASEPQATRGPLMARLRSTARVPGLALPAASPAPRPGTPDQPATHEPRTRTRSWATSLLSMLSSPGLADSVAPDALSALPLQLASASSWHTPSIFLPQHPDDGGFASALPEIVVHPGPIGRPTEPPAPAPPATAMRDAQPLQGMRLTRRASGLESLLRTHLPAHSPTFNAAGEDRRAAAPVPGFPATLAQPTTPTIAAHPALDVTPDEPAGARAGTSRIDAAPDLQQLLDQLADQLEFDLVRMYGLARKS